MSRDVDISEVVNIIYDLMEHVDPAEELANRGEQIAERLVGPERASAARLTSKHLVADREFCSLLAQDLCISQEEAEEFFMGEPVKRCFKVAVWALDAADTEIMEGGGLHGRRGPRVARLLKEWSEKNQTGAYRRAQAERQYYDEIGVS